ncbi:MAG TPA: hypothetical protein VGH27_02080 [Streptosporangiaceae bacterium]|jgi:hypothetical protein
MKLLVSTNVAIIAGATFVVSGCAPDAAGGCQAVAVTASAGQQATAAQLPAAQSVTLPTGQQVRLSPSSSGGVSVTPLTSSGATAASTGFVQLALNGGQYEIPYEAVPYVGTVLDPRLFDVSYLAEAALESHSSTIPLTISYTGSSMPSLPGITVRHAAGGTAIATVNPAKAAQFGALLASRWRAGQAGLPGISRISLAQTTGIVALPAPLPVAPPALAGASSPASQGVSSSADKNLAYHTLTLRFRGLAGSKGTAVGILQNVNDARLGTYIVPDLNFSSTSSGAPVISGTEGPVKFSVPTGTYSLMFSMLTPHAGTYDGYDAALVAQPQVTVDANETVTLDARAAKPYSATVTNPSTPISDELQYDSLDFVRTSVTGGSCGGQALTYQMGLSSLAGSSINYAASQLSATPTTPVTEGRFYFDAATVIEQAGPKAIQAEPRYYLDFPYVGSVPASLTYRVPAKDLTTVTNQVYASPLLTASSQVISLFPEVYHTWGDWNNESFSDDYIDPGSRADYWYTANPKLTVYQQEAKVGSSSSTHTIYGMRQMIKPGQQITVTWDKAPMSPTGNPLYVSGVENWLNYSGQAFQTTPLSVTVPLASRQDNNAVIYPLFADSDPSQEVNGNPLSDFYSTSTSTSTVQFYRDGTLALTSTGASSTQAPATGTYLPMLPQAAHYRLDWVESDSASGASVDTDWGFSSSPDDPAASLPKTELCPVNPGEGCSLLPLLFVNYDLPLNYDGQATAGQPLDITFTVGHQPNAAAATDVKASVAASFDDGQTWTTPKAAASQANGQFTFTIQQPALSSTSGFVSLRIRATDGSGDSITQTIIRAYGLTS